jgi:DNA-binding IclR family transcriptional regulator
MAQRTNLRIAKNEKKIDVDELMAQIAEARRKGYAMSSGVVSPGAGIIGMALPREPNEAQLAIGIGSVLERLEPAEKRIVKIMREVLEKHGFGHSDSAARKVAGLAPAGARKGGRRSSKV